MGQRVGAVGGDADVEHVIGFISQRLGQRFPQRGSFRQYPDAVGLLADPQFRLGTDHAFGDLAADLRLADLEPSGQFRPDRRHRHQLAFRHIGRAADDRQFPLASHRHRTERQLIGIGMLGFTEHFSHHHPGQVQPLAHHVLHFETDQGQRLAQFFRRHGKVDIFF